MRPLVSAAAMLWQVLEHATDRQALEPELARCTHETPPSEETQILALDAAATIAVPSLLMLTDRQLRLPAAVRSLHVVPVSLLVQRLPDCSDARITLPSELCVVCGLSWQC